MPDQWVWISPAVAVAIHREQLAEHGGPDGVRDLGLLESGMARCQNLAAYGENDVTRLAAALAWGVARNHPFVDGNKRTAAVLCETFLQLNGHRLTATDAQVVVTFQTLAAGELSEEELADWLRDHLA